MSYYRIACLSKKFPPESIPAVRDGMVFEIKPADILSPGPAAISEGRVQAATLICQWQERRN